MMLTRSFRVNGTTIDPAGAVADAVRAARKSARRSARGSARDFQAPEDIRRALDEVPDRLEDAIEAASDSIREAGETLRATVHELTAPPERRRMPTGRGWLAGIGIVVAAVALTTLVVRRVWSPSTEHLDDEVRRLDREDLDRATGEGMGTAPGAPERRSSLTTGAGLLSPLDARESPASRLTGVMADPATSAAGAEQEAASANGVVTSSDRAAG
jgi:hypothetical protein